VSILPEGPEEFESFLHACLMEKAVYELEYELNNRPDWVYIPLTGLLDLLGAKV
jgi:maltose alpha-D-glucosyltransferase/alpha-amylase